MGSARIQLCYQVDGLAATTESDGNLDSFRGGTVVMRKGEFRDAKRRIPSRQAFYQPGTNGSESSGRMCTTNVTSIPAAFAAMKTLCASISAATRRSPSTATH